MSTLLFILPFSGMLSGCASPAPEVEPASDSPSVSAEYIEVVYFHRSQRCSGCVYAENGIRYTLDTYFADDMEKDKIIFKVINLEDEENQFTVAEYGAYTSSLFINVVGNGTDHIREVTDIWILLYNNEVFVDVVKSEISASLLE